MRERLVERRRVGAETENEIDNLDNLLAPNKRPRTVAIAPQAGSEAAIEYKNASTKVVGEWMEEEEENPISLGIWHFTLRFVLPGVGLANPVDLERRAVSYWTQSLPKEEKEEFT